MRSPIVWGVITAVIMVAAAGAWFYGTRTDTQAPAAAPVERQLPRDSGAMLVLSTRDDRTITVPDFTYGHPSVEVEDTGLTYVYVTQDDSQTEADPRYGIVYGSNSTIAIGLLEGPLSTSRSAAEAKLRELIPIPDDVLCALPVVVRAAATIDARYTGKELGLSFCPGAVPTP